MSEAESRRCLRQNVHDLKVQLASAETCVQKALAHRPEDNLRRLLLSLQYQISDYLREVSKADQMLIHTTAREELLR
jgi:hypothetical protein